jgi:DNA-directed RNA polymerase specialized sigma subunit
METKPEQAKSKTNAVSLLFSDSLKRVVADFSPRAQEIIFSRYGVFNSHALTLEEIGKKYQITRERVRQVIREVLKKVREKKNEQIFQEIRETIVLALKDNSGIMEEKNLLNALGEGRTSEQAAATFLLECIDDVISVEEKGELMFSFSLQDFDLSQWRIVKNAAIVILKAQKKPLSIEKMFDLLKADLKEINLTKESLAHYLEISHEIKKNTFGKWGIAKWKEISPKGTREKSYLVLKEAGKPLHFRDIAKKIDQYHLNKKKTHAQTVHNELIKDKNFVLVGRGIYALVEWGYESGTVKDVIADIIKKSDKALNKDEILAKVLELRHVKKSTIVINLNNYFAKSKTGTYSIKK